MVYLTGGDSYHSHGSIGSSVMLRDRFPDNIWSLQLPAHLPPPPISNNSMENSPLARLPPELREYIYELVLRDPSHLTVHLSSGRPKLSQPSAFRHHPLALAQTCAQLRDESLSIFFRINTFALETDHITTHHPGYGLRTSWLNTLRQWLDAIGDDNRRQLRDVDFDIGKLALDIASDYNKEIIEIVCKSLQPAFELFNEHRTKLSLRCKPQYMWHTHFFRELRFSLQDAEAAQRDIGAYRSATRKDYGSNRADLLGELMPYVQAMDDLEPKPYTQSRDILEFVRLVREQSGLHRG